jgi:hypothetical protein
MVKVFGLKEPSCGFLSFFYWIFMPLYVEVFHLSKCVCLSMWGVSRI